jgi:hypothetical protein
MLEADEYAKHAIHWLHGVKEQELFRVVLSQGLGGVVLSSALNEEELQKASRIALSEEEMEDADHVQCYQSMLKLLTKSWDVDGVRILLEIASGANVPFSEFDKDMLHMDTAIVRHTPCEETDKCLGQVVELLGNFHGPPYFMNLFERLGFYCACPNCADTNKAITLVWGFTTNLWQGQWRDSCNYLQRKAITSPCQKLFDLMRANGCYDASRNLPTETFSTLHFVRNASICSVLVRERMLNLDLPFGENGKTPLAFDAEWAQGGDVARVLLDAGANVYSLLSATRICPKTLWAALDTHPEFADSIFCDEHFSKILHPFVRGTREAFLLARCVKFYARRKLPPEIVEQLVTLASSSTVDDSDSSLQVLCALFCFRCIDLSNCKLHGLLHSVPEDRKELFFMWRQHTHEYCAENVKERVTASFLALQSTCPQLPPEIQHLIVAKAEAIEWFEN